MAFYTESWIICNLSEEKVVLCRKVKNDIILERIVGDPEIEEKQVLANDILVEYDMDLSLPNKIYLLYQNQERYLILKIIEDKNSKEIKLTPGPIGEVVNLNIKVIDKKIHILYITRMPGEEHKYNIHHHYYNGTSWNDFKVEEITAKKVLNPIKVIKDNNNILLSYYRKDNEIVLREFKSEEVEWRKETIISDTEEEKLFLDMIKIKNIIHITYCEYNRGTLAVRYKGLLDEGGEYEKYLEETISNEGSPSHPNLILFKDKLWISWVELNKIISRYSEDMGQTWDTLLQWEDSRNMNFLRYKYLTMEIDDNILLDHSFGSISPQVRLMGFGPTRNTREIPLKKNQSMNIPRI